MGRPALSRLVPEAGNEVCAILDARRGPVDPPIRGEIFGPERFTEYGRTLGEAQRADDRVPRSRTFFPRLAENIRALREALHYIALHAESGYYVNPAAEWLLDNSYVIDRQVRAVRDGLPRRYFRDLPALVDDPLAGLPRIYGVAWSFIAHTDSAFDEPLLTRFLESYQKVRELTLGELWALPTTLRVVLVENLRRLAERIAVNKAARELAHVVGDDIERYSIAALDRILALLRARGAHETFLTQLAPRMQDRRAPEFAAFRDWLDQALPNPAAIQIQQPAEQTADNLSVSNAIGALRRIDAANWGGIVARTNATMQLLLTLPTFAAERDDTRDSTLHAVERLARRSGRGERRVAQALVDLMRSPAPEHAARASETGAPNYWLCGPGRRELAERIGLDDRWHSLWRALRTRGASPAYLGVLAAGTTALTAAMLAHHGATWMEVDVPTALRVLAAVLMAFPASEAVVAVINRLISESIPPRRLPRLALRDGIPREHRVMVVIPAMLVSGNDPKALVHRIELHHLANPEREAQFALLTDWADSPTRSAATDAELLADAQQRVRALNDRYPVAAGASPRFIVLHRPRRFSETEQRWIGWERKRGKLEQLIDVLAAGRAQTSTESPFLDLGVESRIAPGIRYVVTLDADTELPPGRLRELVGVASHPENQPLVDGRTRTVVRGYAVVQPRVVTPLPATRELTPYHWLFAGHPGIDPYSVATSELYQDVFAEGSFIGKGLLHVEAAHAVLAGRLPEGQVLSHDLLEGSVARCAAATDITVVEDAPFHSDVAASRMERWIRGDWQLLPLLFGRETDGVKAINRWKMIDNLRRSLVAPMSLGLIVLALTGGVVSPASALALVFAAYAAGPLLGAIAGFAPSKDQVAKAYFYRQAGIDLLRALGSGAWALAQLLQTAMQHADAVVRALYRTFVSRRNLLRWTTAAAAQAGASRRLAAIVRRHWRESAVAVALGTALAGLDTPHLALSFALCGLWGAAPLWTWLVSRPWQSRRDHPRTPADAAYLEGVARDTWRLFERCVGADDHHLPPDNLQVVPSAAIAHRTSPTNIGLYLLGAACARQFGWIGTEELLARLDSTLATMRELPRHRGHFLNWYDTASRTPLAPMYVSTVDSGNLSASLLAVAQACSELARAPYDTLAARRALAASRARIESTRAAPVRAAPEAALTRALALPDPVAELSERPDFMEQLLRDVRAELAKRLPDDDALAPESDPTIFRVADHLAALSSALRDVRAAAVPAPEGDSASAAARLDALARTCRELAWEADFSFLYDAERHLLHIGYRVLEQQLDAGCYDLLASEARLTGLLAIARGDAAVDHWASLSRPAYAVGAYAGLRSWSGSMFEYLLPSLLLEEPQGSVLHGACRAAVREHIAYGRSRRVPWGISESAYAARDASLAYQYTAHGVPRLALRRTPQDVLVVAPYATALAAQFAPRRAASNFERLEKLGARGRYGFMESLDYTPARQVDSAGFVRVATYMAHHQAMVIVALANVLQDGAPRRWGMAEPRIEAVASLLHERAPREISALPDPPPSPLPDARRHRGLGLLRQVAPESTAVLPTHLLSNGRYSVALRANGAGWSRWGRVGITRWRDDALRDAHGSFFYIRRNRESALASLTQHPAPDAAARYEGHYHSDRVTLAARWSDLDSRITVWVSAEDDIEFRTVELANRGDRPLELELISAFDVTLAEPASDAAHPAFSNMFVSARWLATHGALLFERKPRLPTEHGVHMAHFLAANDSRIARPRVATDRARWLGRNRDASEPLGSFGEIQALAAASEEGAALDTGLDPVCAMSAQVRIAPRSTVRLTFCTAASDERATLLALVDKYRQKGPIERASLMSATLTSIRHRELQIDAQNLIAVHTLTTALEMVLTRPHGGARVDDRTSAFDYCDRKALWRFGISGDRPIVLISASDPQGVGLLRTMAQALRIWSWGGAACDLVVVNGEARSYEMPLQREIAALRERYAAEAGGSPGETPAGFHVIDEEELSAHESSTLRVLARIVLEADGRSLFHQLREWLEPHDEAFAKRAGVTRMPLARARSSGATGPGSDMAIDVPDGRFSTGGDEFEFEVDGSRRPPRPWVNVIANPRFGTQLSEAGGGYTWALNSRMNQLTPWSNDPVTDPPGEWFLVQDATTRETWSITPSPCGDRALGYRVTHGQGYSTIEVRRRNLEVHASFCVDARASIKEVRIRLVNRGRNRTELRAVAVVEWLMGAHRSDRVSVATSAFQRALASGPIALARGGGVVTGDRRTLLALTATQCERGAGFGGGTAFLATADAADAPSDWTCDRRECFDVRGCPVLPLRFARRSGAGLDPCAAMATHVSLAAGQSVECVFVIGHGATPDEARRAAIAAFAEPATPRLEEARAQWRTLQDAATVRTPDPLFDALVNRWLLYQAVSCRLWARAAFYQAGGAFGFRDQLQDAMALAWAKPQLLREQLLLAASRQFEEGDVQHWWHPPLGAGVRTHSSDDLLWLPYACFHYVLCTGDLALFDEPVPFLTGEAIPEGAEDAYFIPAVSPHTASVFEHCARAIDRCLAVGAHGLPLIGTGDWNDGMNRIGHQGRGESVWLAWFLCRLVADLAPVARARGDDARALRWSAAVDRWKQALRRHGWDGRWYKRAFFDDGTPLGSHANAECRIDLIAQAWAVLSGAAPAGSARMAMHSAESQLVDPGGGLIRLLAPPLRNAHPSAGYIQAYPVGVRENGGQYSHAGVWALMAQAQLGDADAAYRYFTYLSPAHRARDTAGVRAYGIEPYVLAGDIYSAPPYTGRGGWSWYTGSAAWLYRAAIETMFGMRQRGATLSFEPCLPSHWDEAELTLRRNGRTITVSFVRRRGDEPMHADAAVKGLRPGEAIDWRALPPASAFVMTLPVRAAPPAVPQRSAIA